MDEEVWIDAHRISFPRLAASISVGESPVWQPPSVPVPLGTIKNRRSRVETAAREIIQRRSGVGLSPLLGAFLGYSEFQSGKGSKFRPQLGDIHSIQGFLENKDMAALAGLLPEFLGSGQGLTPSGDDFVIGTLLSLNRWHEPRFSDDDLSPLNRAIVSASYNRTTRISANLIECAALDQADERLIDAVDYLATGEERYTGVIPRLLDWGNSSGVDAFVGMAVALLSG
jgi:hypothetical protein